MALAPDKGLGNAVEQDLLEHPHPQEQDEENGVVPGGEQSLQDKADALHKGVLAICSLRIRTEVRVC